MSSSRAKITSPAAAASAFAYNTMFNTMEEAEATGVFSLCCILLPTFFLSNNWCPFAFTTVDDFYLLDFDHPEANGFGFFVFKATDIKSADRRFLYDKARFMITNGITDLADIVRVAGTIVFGGQAFHLAISSVPEHLKEQCESFSRQTVAPRQKSSTSST
jgi:hypothetical protein